PPAPRPVMNAALLRQPRSLVRASGRAIAAAEGVFGQPRQHARRMAGHRPGGPEAAWVSVKV
ncbi:MAG TPA: hypothetical protein VFG12_10725, partial [Rhodopila sp.]|nr:hypothetical protein [Rhodopila sp.]